MGETRIFISAKKQCSEYFPFINPLKTLEEKKNLSTIQKWEAMSKYITRPGIYVMLFSEELQMLKRYQLIHPHCLLEVLDLSRW